METIKDGRRMNESNEQEFLPKKLVKTLIGLWLSLINVGLDFGLFMKAERSPAVILLIVVCICAIGFSVYFTRELLDLFREQQGIQAPDRTPDIV